MKETLSKELDELVLKHFGKNFKFRKYQKELIIDICNTFLTSDKKGYIIEAPTGFGKSILNLCVAKLLNLHGKNGYILASDLSLHQQYVADVKKYNLCIANVAGVDNYNCPENGEKHSLGECTMCNIPHNKRKTLPCYLTCPYYSARDIAIKSATAILTYPYALICRNYVDRNGDSEMWGQRDFVICDEAHKVVEIVQNHFSPRIDIATNSKLEKLRDFFISHEFGDIKQVSKNELSVSFDKMFSENDVNKLQQILINFEYQLEYFKEKAELMKTWLSRKYAFKSVPAEYRAALYLIDFVKDIHCKFEDYNIIIQKSGVNSLIKNPDKEGVTFNTLNESYLMQKHFHEQFGYSVWTSATIGDISIFCKNTKLNNTRSIRLPSNFNFKQSPIFAFSGKKMSFNEKEKSFPWAIEKVKEIAELHKNEKGIIHTGSYDLTNKLYKELPKHIKKRLLIYNNSEEKHAALYDFYNSNDKILIGPSILEGVSFDDDHSRFQVFFKIPYPSLMDRFVSSKMKIDQTWYDTKTVLQVIQGIGRSIRNDKDYCKTYITDSCFIDLYKKTRNMFPIEFHDRLIFIPHQTKNWWTTKSLI